MHLARRRFLQLSSTLLGPGLLDFLRTPVWRWTTHPFLAEQGKRPAANPPAASATASPAFGFVDVAREAGLRTPNTWGGVQAKSFILEAKSSGIAFFDYDHDGWLDIYLTKAAGWARHGPQAERP